MDYSLTDEQTELAAVAARLLARAATPERLTQLALDRTWPDPLAWSQLAEAGLLGACLPEEHGGGGAGFVELALLLEQVGAHVAPVPLLECVLLGALPLARFGTPEQQARDLPGVAAGTTLLTAALVESGRDDLLRPLTTAQPDGDGYRLSGTKSAVPLADQARRLVVPASTPEGRVVLALVAPTADGVVLRAQTSTHGQPQSEVELTGVRVGPEDVLVGPDEGAAALSWLLDRALVGTAATALGAAARALRMAAEYTSEREQFGRRIATFQAVGHRLADTYIDVEAMRLTVLQACWRLDAGLPASAEAAVAKWWTAEGGHRVAHATAHVHGGMGVAVEYPLHRYFLWLKHLEFSFGGATAQLLRLGAALAADPV